MNGHKHAAILAQAAEEAKPANPRECLAEWHKELLEEGGDPWGAAWGINDHPPYPSIHMIEVTPEVRAALDAAGIEVSQ